ncbi:hypothetical protein [Streptomyces sp. NPDC087300]|uniref:hypothetical protein n=1 Tax=Streptomyces sp. NPDC087300 TaxID=3365780 RepID=UPI0038289533
MSDLLPFLVIFGGFGAVLAALTWLATSVRRRGAAGGAVGAALASWEEAFRVTAHESHVEIKAQADRKAPADAPDGGWQPYAHKPRPAGGPGRGPATSRRRRPGTPLRRRMSGWLSARGR